MFVRILVLEALVIPSISRLQYTRNYFISKCSAIVLHLCCVLEINFFCYVGVVGGHTMLIYVFQSCMKLEFLHEVDY
jgi:hypothetical protein